MISRRQFLVGLFGLAGGTITYARFFEPRWLELTSTAVTLRRRAWTSPVRLLHLADFHASNVVPLSFINEAVDMGLTTNPDLICLTGDFVTGHFRDAQAYRGILRRLVDTAPTFACTGNHDGGAWAGPRGGYDDISAVLEFLSDCGVHVLYNRSEILSVHGGTLKLVGVGDLWAGEMDPVRAFAGTTVEGNTPTLLLSHNPDSKDQLADYDWDLMLCGHTHGGQIVLPILGAPLAPVVDHRFLQGLHDWEDRWIHVTRGVGNLHGVRFNCRPEVSLLTLT